MRQSGYTHERLRGLELSPAGDLWEAVQSHLQSCPLARRVQRLGSFSPPPVSLARRLFPKPSLCDRTFSTGNSRMFLGQEPKTLAEESQGVKVLVPTDKVLEAYVWDITVKALITSCSCHS